MVRLRSDRWFSADGQRRSHLRVSTHNSGIRRLISLCFLLALVVLLMQKASDPTYVSSAFRTLGVPLNESAAHTAGTAGENAARQTTIGESSGSNKRWRLVCKDMVPRLLGSLTDRQTIEVAHLWFTRVRAPSDPQSPPSDDTPQIDVSTDTENKDAERLSPLQASLHATLEDASSEIETLSQSLSASDSDWQSLLGDLSDEWHAFLNIIAIPDASVNQHTSPPTENGLTDHVATISPEFRDALSEYLDARLLDSLNEASPWSKREATAFWRLMQRSNQLSSAVAGNQHSSATDSLTTSNTAGRETPRLSTLQLESERDAIKGNRIRYRGSIRRVEKIERNNVEFGIENGYWLSWLRGEDNSTQPVAVYGTQSEFLSLSDRVQDGDFPEVEIVALIGKRLAYGSEAGVQVAPTLFAISVATSTENAGSTNAGTADFQQDASWQRDAAWALLGGILLAGFLCSIILRSRSNAPVMNRRGQHKGRALGWLLAAFLVTPAISHPSIAVAQEQAVPWAQVDSQQERARQMLQERLGEALEANDLRLLQTYLETPAEYPVPDCLLRIKHVINQFGWQRAHDLNVSTGSSDGGYEISAHALSGWVRSIAELHLTEEQDAWFSRNEGEKLYLLKVDKSPPATTVDGTDEASLQGGDSQLVICRDIPDAWLGASTIRQPIKTTGYAIQYAPAGRVLCILSDRLDWIIRPSELNELQPPLADNLLLLAELGWNLSFCDLVTKNNQQSLGASEANAFFSMLRLLDATSARSLVEEHIDASAKPTKLLASPAESLGRAVRWPVRLVTCSVVDVGPEERDALAGESYFQFDGFVDMGNERVRFQVDSERPEQDLIFEREFPVTIVMRGRSEFTPTIDLESGNRSWEVGKFAEVEGCFYRLWSYESEILQQRNSKSRQAAPLIVASRLSASVPVPRSGGGRQIGWFGYALCLATLTILGAILISVAQSQRRNPRV